MGNPRSFTSKFNAMNKALESAVKPAGFNSLKRRRDLIRKAAAGRPADLPEIARVELERWRKDREFKAVIDSIAGTSA